MIDVEVEPHADGVGGDEVIDVARLIERDLRVPGARRERAEHDGGAAALAADQFGDGVNFIRGESDNRRAARQARQFLLAGISEHGQPRPADDVRAGQQFLDHRPHRRGAEHERFLARTAIEHAVGEDVAALEVGAELDLVDGEEGDIEILRHRLDGRDPVARGRRLDLLLAGDQRDEGRADAIDDLVVDLARQKAQRQADHAGGMGEHPLDGEMRLAGIGGAEDRGDAGAAGTRGPCRLRRETEGHYRSRLTAGPRSKVRPRVLLYHNATACASAVKVWNGGRTNRARIA